MNVRLASSLRNGMLSNAPWKNPRRLCSRSLRVFTQMLLPVFCQILKARSQADILFFMFIDSADLRLKYTFKFGFGVSVYADFFAEAHYIGEKR